MNTNIRTSAPGKKWFRWPVQSVCYFCATVVWLLYCFTAVPIACWVPIVCWVPIAHWEACLWRV